MHENIFEIIEKQAYKKFTRSLGIFVDILKDYNKLKLPPFFFDGDFFFFFLKNGEGAILEVLRL
jgi:hypothetical protein